MNKINIPSLNKVNITNLKEVDFLGNKILVKSYLPMEDKISLIEVVMQNAIEFNFVNPTKVEAYFNAYLVAKYTNIDFSEYLDDIYGLYDLVEQSGLLQLVIDNAYDDYEFLKDQCESFVTRYETYQNSLYGVVSKIISDVPEQLGVALDELSKLDFNKVGEVVEKIQASGGNSEAVYQLIAGAGKGQK